MPAIAATAVGATAATAFAASVVLPAARDKSNQTRLVSPHAL